MMGIKRIKIVFQLGIISYPDNPDNLCSICCKAAVSLFFNNFLKKIFAILALSVFFLAHFGRMINYLYCKAQTYAQTASFACDCEKQLLAGLIHDNGGHKEEPPKNIASSMQEEPLYHLPAHAELHTTQIIPFTKWPPANKQALCWHSDDSIFRPPLLFLA